MGKSNQNQELIKARDAFREAADIIDEMLILENQEETPETVKEYESVLGRFAIKMMQLQNLDM